MHDDVVKELYACGNITGWMEMEMELTRDTEHNTDTSKYTSGAVLTQMDSNGDRHPVAYFLKTFNNTERNYEIYDRELLGVI